MLRHLTEEKIVGFGHLTQSTRFYYPDGPNYAQRNPYARDPEEINTGLIQRFLLSAGSVEIQSCVRLMIDCFEGTSPLPPGFSLRLVLHRNSPSRLLWMLKGQEGADDELASSQVDVDVLKCELMFRKIRLAPTSLVKMHQRLTTAKFRSFFIRRHMQKVQC